jgi:hypothetical protein
MSRVIGAKQGQEKEGIGKNGDHDFFGSPLT